MNRKQKEDIKDRKQEEAQKLITRYLKHKKQLKNAFSSSEDGHQFSSFFSKDVNSTDKPEGKCHFFQKYKLVILLLVIIVYSLVGGLIFWLVESSVSLKNNEVELKHSEIEEEAKKFVACFQQNSNDAAKCIPNIIEVMKKREGVETVKSTMTYSNALFYSFTVLTTIGYGHISCHTNVGKFITVIYGLIGIPLMVFVLRNNGKYMLKLVAKIEELAYGEHYKSESAFLSVSVKSAIFYNCSFWLFSSLMMVNVEQFTVLDSFYFSFSTFSTVGFGDITPNTFWTELFVIFAHFMSLSLISMSFEILSVRKEAKYMHALQWIDEEFQRSRPNSRMENPNDTKNQSGESTASKDKNS